MNTSSHTRFRLGWILIAIAVVNSLFWLVLRWSYENSFVRAQITVDYDDTRTMADAFQVPHKKLLADLQARGVTSVALYAQSLSNLREGGRVDIISRIEAEQLYPTVLWGRYLPAYRYVVTAPRDSQTLLTQIYERLTSQGQESVPPKMIALLTPRSGKVSDIAQFGILIPASRQLINDAQLGFDPAQVSAVRDAGMQITARLPNAINSNLTRVRRQLDDATEVGARVVIFAEDEVLGYDTMMPAVAQEMRDRGLVFGNVEFTKQRGWPDIAKQSGGLLARVHSVGGDEAAKAKTEMLVERFVRAVKERNIRIAYIRFVRQFKGEYTPPWQSTAPANAVPILPPVDNMAAQETILPTPEPSAEVKKTALEQNLAFFEEVSTELEKQPLPFAWLRPGLIMGGPDVFGNYPISVLSPHVGGGANARMVRYIGLWLSALGAVGAVLLMLNLFFDLNPGSRARWCLAGIGIITFLLLFDMTGDFIRTEHPEHVIFKVLSYWPDGMGVKAIGLVTGCLFSVIGMLWGGLPDIWTRAEAKRADRDANVSDAEPQPDEAVPPGRAFLPGCAVLAKTSLIMLLGPLILITLFNHWKYFSKTDEFLGEKATLLVPLLLTALAFSAEVFPSRVLVEGAAAARARAMARLRSVLDHPFTTRVAVTSVFLVIAGMIFIARTGNDSGMEISPLELKVRAALEQIFVTRPRTKEVFFGHPAMIFAVWFALRRHWLFFWAAAIIATIGQADMLNTFCHFHTPLLYSFLRSFHSVWVGALLGGLALWLWARVLGPFLTRTATRARIPVEQDAPTDAPPSPSVPTPVTQPIEEQPIEKNGVEKTQVPPAPFPIAQSSEKDGGKDGKAAGADGKPTKRKGARIK